MPEEAADRWIGWSPEAAQPLRAAEGSSLVAEVTLEMITKR